MLISFLLLYASIRINCINIRNGAKMEPEQFERQHIRGYLPVPGETNFSEYLSIPLPSSSYTEMLEDTVREGLSAKVPLSTDDYKIKNITLDFHVTGDRVKYILL